jgi:phenylpropionate dioxygenase-like ring-hydroxylating dioxygenase large terminal subunit
MDVLRNTWYMAAWADELGPDTLIGRTLLGEAVVLFRDRAGVAHAIGDRCPHRFAPLHLGKHVGDAVQCGYHGLEFGGDGLCSRNPHGQGTLPRTASVPSYALVERYGVLWIWMGNAPADESIIPADFGFVGDDTRAHIKGYLHVKANYLLLVDNLMDLSHGLYLHAGFLATEEMREDFTPHARLDGDVVVCEREQPGIEPPAIWAPALPAGTTRIDYYSNVYWYPPALVIHPVGCRMLGKPDGVDGGVSSRSAHMFTPETDTTSHYFYDNSRDYAVDSPDTDNRIRGMLAVVFGEQDRPMIEAQQRLIGNVDLMKLNPSVLPTDRATVLMRRRLAQLISRESAAHAEEAVAATAATVAG